MLCCSPVHAAPASSGSQHIAPRRAQGARLRSDVSQSEGFRRVRKPAGPPPSTPADAATVQLQVPNMRAVNPKELSLLPPRRDADLPIIHEGRAVVLVEGFNDALVVRDSVHAPVMYVGGTNLGKTHRARLLMAQIADVTDAVIILPDPDGEGGRFRTAVAIKLATRAWHAFMPVSRAVGPGASANHQFGNTGIEHAQPSDVLRALQRAKPYRPTSGNARMFNRDMLREWGLSNPFDANARGERIEHAALRREILCNALGLARMDSRRLQQALNMYSFTVPEVWSCIWALHVLPGLQIYFDVEAGCKLLDQASRQIQD
jgi:5S rRNA maturation endonuclease (ribonuclease M5)